MHMVKLYKTLLATKKNAPKNWIACKSKSMYRISANSCRDNYSFLEALDATTIQGRQLFKGGNYSRKYGMYNVGII